MDRGWESWYISLLDFYGQGHTLGERLAAHCFPCFLTLGWGGGLGCGSASGEGQGVSREACGRHCCCSDNLQP